MTKNEAIKKLTEIAQKCGSFDCHDILGSKGCRNCLLKISYDMPICLLQTTATACLHAIEELNKEGR